MIVQSILGPRGLAIVADVGFVLACVAFLWGAIKLAYQRTQGQAMPRNLFTKALDIGVEAFNIVWGAINRVLKFSGSAGIFLPTQPTDGAPVLARAELEGRLAETERSRDALMRAIEESTAAPPRHDGQRGSVNFGSLLFVAWMLAAVGFAGAMLTGCPNWNRPACGSRGEYSCVRNQPHYCAAGTGELTPMGDEPCDRSGKVCVIDPDGVGNCELPADGGVR
jgi:hypothetical protein